MNDLPQPIIKQLRSLMPVRPLEEYEARGIAERQAKRLLELLDQHEPGVNVGLIAEISRIHVGTAPRLKTPPRQGEKRREVSGYSLLEDGIWLIMVNSTDSRTRRRFTLSHEFKHVLDDPFVEVAYKNLGANKEERARKIEQLCEYFAACVLMPRNWLKQAWASGIQNQALLAAMFDVSPRAMSVRLQQLGLVDRESRFASLGELSRPVRSYFRRGPLMQPMSA